MSLILIDGPDRNEIRSAMDILMDDQICTGCHSDEAIMTAIKHIASREPIVSCWWPYVYAVRLHGGVQ
jgi:hypothetical protein